MKVQVAKVDLEGVYKVKSKGHTYFYAWRGKGAPRIKAKEGSAEFIEELAQAIATRHTGDGKSIRSLCAMWKVSPAWTVADPMRPEEKPLAATTKKAWRRYLDDAQDHFGELSLKQFAPERATVIRQKIKAWRSKWLPSARNADMAKQVFSALMSFAVKRDMLASNPCIGIANLYENDRSDRIWTPGDLERLAAGAPDHIMRAARLAALTGLRQSDLMRLSWSHVGELAIQIRTGKSGGKKTTLIPIYKELRDLLATIPKVSTRVLVNSKGLPWKSGFPSSWEDALIAAGFKTVNEDGKVVHDENLHFHDLRGTAATRMYLGSLTIREIAEIMTWGEDNVERLIDRYVKRDELLLDRIRRMDENAAGTPPVKPMKNRPTEIG